MRTCFICTINNVVILKSMFRKKEEKLTFTYGVEIATEIKEASKQQGLFKARCGPDDAYTNKKPSLPTSDVTTTTLQAPMLIYIYI